MADLTKRYTRPTQLNERVSSTEYDVLHPETHADLVITTDNKQFVSAEDKLRWDAAEGSAHYKGLWDAATTYKPGDIVKDEDGYYFIAVSEHSNVVPNQTVKVTFTGITNYWHNISYISNIAAKAEQLSVVNAANNADYFLTFVDSNNNVAAYENFYSDAGIKYNPSTNTLTVTEHSDGTPNIIGKVSEAQHAEEADHALEADHATEADHAATADEATTAHNYFIAAGNTPNLHTTIQSIHKRIDDITQGEGGAVLSNKLYVQKNGTTLNPNGFDGSVEQTVNIEIAPADVTGLLDTNNKINTTWLPDSILGNLKYGGTVNESGVIASNNSTLNGSNINDINAASNPGLYFLAAFTNASASVTLAGISDVRVGDWVVSNGNAGWTKVDNTDAVTMVNSRIGAVETYQGAWTTNTQYYKGDIVKYNGALYIANQNNTGTTFPESSFDIFGKVYTASKGIKLDGNDIQHDVEVIPGESKTEQLNYGSSFVVPSVTTDAYGHVTKVDLNTLTLPAAVIDTWRAINVNGTEALSTSITSGALNFTNGNSITAVYENNVLKFDHNESGYDAGSFDLQKIDTVGTGETNLLMGNGFSVPTFEYDVYGHVKNVVAKTYRLPSSIITHKHFEVATNNGVSQIKAYDAATATTTWLNNSNNTQKFYLGTNVPLQSDQMNFNGALGAKTLYQVNRANAFSKVLDSSISIISGLDNDNQNIVSAYSEANGTITLGDSGVTAGAYSAVSVNAKGIVTAGGQIVEFGKEVNAGPSESLAIGGLFFRRLAAA